VIPQGQVNLLSKLFEFFQAGVRWAGEDIAIVGHWLFGYSLLVVDY
jgi:hypothetical protein